MSIIRPTFASEKLMFNLNQVIMKKTILIAAISAVFLSIALTSCDSGFSEGFRQGWNSTAPEEYRY